MSNTLAPAAAPSLPAVTASALSAVTALVPIDTPLNPAAALAEIAAREDAAVDADPDTQSKAAWEVMGLYFRSVLPHQLACGQVAKLNDELAEHIPEPPGFDPWKWGKLAAGVDLSPPRSMPELTEVGRRVLGRLEMEGYLANARRSLSPPPSGPADRGKAARKTKGKNIDGLMMKIMWGQPESLTWSARQWAERLGCSPSTVKESKAWNGPLKLVKAGAELEAAERYAAPRPTRKN